MDCAISSVSGLLALQMGLAKSRASLKLSKFSVFRAVALRAVALSDKTRLYMNRYVGLVGAVALISAFGSAQASTVNFVEQTNPFDGKEYILNFDDASGTTYEAGADIFATFTENDGGTKTEYQVVFSSQEATSLGGTGQAYLQADDGWTNTLNIRPEEPLLGFGDFVLNLKTAEITGDDVDDFHVVVTLYDGTIAEYDFGGGSGENWLAMEAKGSLITNISITGLTDDGLSSGWSQFKQPRVSDPSVVPLPAAAWLFGSALLGVVGIGHRRRRVT